MVMAAIAVTVSCNGQSKSESKGESIMDSKVLIVFFSHSGENYAVGNVKVGNTKLVADEIQRVTGGDEFEIVAEKNYDMPYDREFNIKLYN